MASPNSYPKTQLSSAVTFVRNSDVIRRELEIVSLQEYYWTDSEVVLGYVNKIADWCKEVPYIFNQLDPMQNI